MPTYAIRIESYTDQDDLHYVYTISKAGNRFQFGEGNRADMEALQADLSKLQPSTVAQLVENSCSTIKDA